MELETCSLLQSFFVYELYKIAEEYSMEKSAIAVGGIVEHAFVAGHIFNNIVGCQCCVGKVLLVAGNKVQFVRSTQECSCVVCENPIFINLALCIYIVIYCAALFVEKFALPSKRIIDIYICL